jgi:hypothetical protein
MATVSLSRWRSGGGYRRAAGVGRITGGHQALRQLISRKPAIRRSRRISLNRAVPAGCLSAASGQPHRRRISLSQRRISSRLTIRVPVNLRRRRISLSQRRISSRLTIRMPVSLRRRRISLSQRRISSRLTIRMPVNLRRRRISQSQRRISSRLRSACRSTCAAGVSA